MENETDSNDHEEIIYPGLLERIKAAVFDSVVLVVLMMILATAFSKFESVPDSARIVGFVFLFILYDPLFTSLFGGTLGHMAIKIRVGRRSNPDKNILFPFAILRYVLKASLGWISLLTVASNENRLAIHDMIVGSMVVYKKKV